MRNIYMTDKIKEQSKYEMNFLEWFHIFSGIKKVRKIHTVESKSNDNQIKFKISG